MEELSRLEILIGKENINKIRNTTVLIIGLGGVGSYALESLVRSGIGKVIIVDKDVVDITNLNRQLMTLKSNVGQLKTDVWKKRINDINDTIEVIKINKFINKDNINDLFIDSIDYVIDACDTVETKYELIKLCHKKGIKLISSMGTGKRLNPSKLEITDIRKTSYDPIAKIIRKKIKNDKINYKINVVCSTEPPIKTEGTVIASNSFVPATAGLLCTSFVINDIIKEN